MNKSNKGDYISQTERYVYWCEIIAKAREVLILNHNHDITFVPEGHKFDGWQGTMKPSY